jgi:hypothetical protein
MELTRAEVDEMFRRADEVRCKLRRATRELEGFGEQVLAQREASSVSASGREATSDPLTPQRVNDCASSEAAHPLTH